MSSQPVQIDPLNSPHPIPWNWVMTLLNTAARSPQRSPSASVHYYRSQALLSPDGQFAAYSRIQMQVQPQLFQSCVSSVLFLENLRSGDLQAVTPTSPLADNPFASQGEPALGTISIVIPIAWSEQGDRLLARVFESIVCSDVASDYAVIVDRAHKRISTIAPTRTAYTTAILLGWSQSDPEQVLFRAGNLGEDNWPLWRVDATGQTTHAQDDRPVTFGQLVSSIWMGPQVQEYTAS